MKQEVTLKAIPTELHKDTGIFAFVSYEKQLNHTFILCYRLAAGYFQDFSA